MSDMQIYTNNQIDNVLFFNRSAFEKNFDDINNVSNLLNQNNTNHECLLSYYYASSMKGKQGLILSSCDITNFNIDKKFDIVTSLLENNLYKTSITYSLTNNNYDVGEIIIFRKSFNDALNDHYKLCNIIQCLK